MNTNPFIEQLLANKEKSVLITTHKSPDGDAMGSSLGLYHFLKSQGFSVKVMVPDAFAHFLAWMPESQAVLIFDQNKVKGKETTQEASYLFCLDYNSFSRVGLLEHELRKSNATTFLIDHHQQPDILNGFVLSDTSASSTCELVYQFIKTYFPHQTIPLESAQCLYTGMMTDTGSFRFPSTSAKTHQIVADLIEIGVKPHQIHEQVLDQNTAHKLQLTGYALHHMQIDAKLQTSYMKLNKAELEQFQYQKGDTEGLVNYGLSIQGIQLSVLVLENDGIIKISFRSKGNIDVNQLARQYFKGGGHKNAAGGQGEVSVEKTLESIQHVLPAFLASTSSCIE